MKALRNLKARHPVALGLGLGVFLAAGAALAAFIIFTGITGSGNGTFAGSTTNAALTFTETSQPPALDQNNEQQMPIKITNNDPNASHTIQTVTGSFTTKDSAGNDDSATCTPFLRLDPGTLVGTTIAAGASLTTSIGIVGDSSLPPSCASGTYVVTFGGTTS